MSKQFKKDAKSLFSFGNLKLGKDTMIFNMTSATDCPSSVKGLCKVGAKCYALKAEKCYPNTLPHRRFQSSFWNVCTPSQFIDVVVAAKTKHIKYLRVNEAGDFRNQADVDKLNLIAKRLKVIGIKTYLYTARTDLVFKDTEFVVNGSSWMADNEFRYIPRGVTPAPDVQVLCPGDCRTCNFCKEKLHMVIGVEQH